MRKNNKEKHFINKPIYEGGLKALRLFIKTNLKYPETALEAKVEGTALVKYTIDYTGKVINAKVVKGLGHGCDEEAIRLVKLLKFKTVKTRKVKIRFFKSIQIHFKLPKPKPSIITYNILTSKNTIIQNKESKKESYSYTIKLG